MSLFVTTPDGATTRQVTKFGGEVDVRYPSWVDPDTLAFISFDFKPNVVALQTIGLDGKGLETVYWVDRPISLASPHVRPTRSPLEVPKGRLTTTWGKIKALQLP